METLPKYPHIHVHLTGADGNGFMVVGQVSRALKRAGVSAEERQAFREEAMSDDYGHLLQTVIKTVEVS